LIGVRSQRNTTAEGGSSYPYVRDVRLFSKGSPGFTLIEILVAMVILTLCLVVIMELFSGGLKGGRISREYLQAVFHAREKMEEILVAPELSAGSKEGRFPDNSLWNVEITPFVDDEAVVATGSVRLFRIALEVRWKEGHRQRNVTISTLTMARVGELQGG
jgi:prepilin-type N-terminal cleavage/methylation domain-containing protein